MTIDEYLSEKKQLFCNKYLAKQSQYKEIWDTYSINMPKCGEICKKQNDSVGPQGIYWIGDKAKILFVGLENYGWKNSSYNVEQTHYRPLEFAFHDIESMPGYWGFIKDVLNSKICPKENLPWHEQLSYVSLTNACKCFGNNRSKIRMNCIKAGYIRKEIEIVGAKINVLFTRTVGLIKQIYGLETGIQYNGNPEIIVHTIQGTIFIETRHPGRSGDKWNIDIRSAIAEYLIKE